MTQFRFIGMLVGLGMMSACSDSDERRTAAQNDNGVDVSLTLDDGEGNAGGAGNETRIAIDLPGLKGGLKIPGIKIGSGDFDIDGVPLYPGAQVTGFDVRGQDGGSEGSVTLRFKADAVPAKVQSYFLDGFKAKDMAARADGKGVTGTTHDGKPFRIQLNDQDGGTRGIIVIGPEAA
jgi:hypothetical protein